jgi:hypothetical protein
MAKQLPVSERLSFAEVKKLFETDYPASLFRVVQGGVDASVNQGRPGDSYHYQPMRDVPPPQEVEMLLAKDGWHCVTSDWGRLWLPRRW